MHDLIIIGGGPAGITASVYAARKKMDFLLITGDIGGQAAWSGDVENYTGYQFITGPELAVKFEEHMKKYDIKTAAGQQVINLVKSDDKVIIKTKEDGYEAKAVIIASGKRSRELNVPGEKEFKNKGLAYCATCDGPLFANKDVAVIGGGNSALDAALQLASYAAHVRVLNNTPELNGDPILLEKLLKNNKVTVINGVTVKEVKGEKVVTGVLIRGKDGEELVPVKGVFVEIGLIPNAEFTEGIDKNGIGEIKINSNNETNVAGIFAAGDVTDVPEKQIIIAAGEGAKAALMAYKYLLHS